MLCVIALYTVQRILLKPPGRIYRGDLWYSVPSIMYDVHCTAYGVPCIHNILCIPYIITMKRASLVRGPNNLITFELDWIAISGVVEPLALPISKISLTQYRLMNMSKTVSHRKRWTPEVCMNTKMKWVTSIQWWRKCEPMTQLHQM